MIGRGLRWPPAPLGRMMGQVPPGHRRPQASAPCGRPRLDPPPIAMAAFPRPLWTASRRPRNPYASLPERHWRLARPPAARVPRLRRRACAPWRARCRAGRSRRAARARPSWRAKARIALSWLRKLMPPISDPAARCRRGRPEPLVGPNETGYNPSEHCSATQQEPDAEKDFGNTA